MSPKKKRRKPTGKPRRVVKGDFASDPEAIKVDTGQQVPAGQWVGVQQGQVVAPDTYYDTEGYLRDVTDHSYVAWHWGRGRCLIRGLTPADLVTDPETGARWCPSCFELRRQFYQEQEDSKRLEKLFGTTELSEIKKKIDGKW